MQQQQINISKLHIVLIVLLPGCRRLFDATTREREINAFTLQILTVASCSSHTHIHTCTHRRTHTHTHSLHSGTLSRHQFCVSQHKVVFRLLDWLHASVRVAVCEVCVCVCEVCVCVCAVSICVCLAVPGLMWDLS